MCQTYVAHVEHFFEGPILFGQLSSHPVPDKTSKTRPYAPCMEHVPMFTQKITNMYEDIPDEHMGYLCMLYHYPTFPYMEYLLNQPMVMVQQTSKGRSWRLSSPLDCGCAPGLLLLGVDLQCILVGVSSISLNDNQILI